MNPGPEAAAPVTSNEQQLDSSTGWDLGGSSDATFISRGSGGVTFYFIGCCHSPLLGDEETEFQLNREMKMIVELHEGTTKNQRQSTDQSIE